MSLEIKSLKQWLQENIKQAEGLLNKILTVPQRNYLEGKVYAYEETIKRIDGE